MENIAISKFKAQCLAILERVRRTGEPIRITRFGEPVAEIVPPTKLAQDDHWIGRYRGSVRIVGDIVEPAVPAEDWEALRD